MRLLTIEYLKIRSNYTLIGIFAAYLVMLPITLLILGTFNIGPQFEEIVDVKDIYRSPYNWQIIPYLASWFNSLLSLGVVFFIGSEFSANMYRKNFVDGLSREELYLSRVMSVFLLSLFVAVYLLAVISLFGAIYADGDVAGTMLNFRPLLLFWFQSFCYFSFALFLVTWLKSAIFAILIFIAYYFVEFIISFPVSKGYEVFLMFDAFSELVPRPFIDEMKEMMIQQGLDDYKGYRVDLVPYVSAFYLVALQVGTYMLMKYRRL